MICMIDDDRSWIHACWCPLWSFYLKEVGDQRMCGLYIMPHHYKIQGRMYSRCISVTEKKGQFSMIFRKRECMLKSLQMCNNCILQSMMVWEGLQHHGHQWKNCFTVDWLETLIIYSPNFIIIFIRFLNDFSQSFMDSLDQIMCVCEPP